jgi:deoxyribose-phosphate aldolase
VTDRADVARRALGLIDLTDLADRTTAEAIAELCRRAAGPNGSTAAVCVWPEFVARAADALRGSGVTVATVVNFPDGGDDVPAVVQQIDESLASGADEIDLVLPYHAFLAGDLETAASMVDAARAAVPSDKLLKVILETGSYPNQRQVADAAALAIEHGADFIKTSTGKTSVSATPDAVRTMLDEIRRSGRPVGLKPSGGIRTVDDAARYLALADEMMGDGWATRDTFRFGASGLLDAIEATIARPSTADAGVDGNESDY